MQWIDKEVGLEVGMMALKNPEQLSSAYYRFISDYVQTEFEDEKILGKFYTDCNIADSMVEIICNNLDMDISVQNMQTIKIIDPFCGDGRLILKLLSSMNRHNILKNKNIKISIWDIDKNAVSLALRKIQSYSASNNLLCSIDARALDAYVEYKKEKNLYDICITNPPWSLLKPQKFFKKNNTEKLAEYYTVTEQYDNYMKEEFVVSQPSSRFGKWGTNLARCGVEVALQLIKRDGLCGIVSPASLLNDQVSLHLRHWIFENYRVINVSYYPAELKLYGNADIASITMVVKGGETKQSFSLRTYDDINEYKCEEIGEITFNYIKEHNYNFPFKTGIGAIPIIMYFEQFPSTKTYCESIGLKFTRELDETRVKEKLTENGQIEFAKGYMVDRYSFKGNGLYLKENVVKVPHSSHCYKIVWRNVSRDSQIRRIKATLLSPGYICGNSLEIIYGEEQVVPYLKMLLAIMNSLIYEYQARSMLVSNHVSAGIVKQIHVPKPQIRQEIINLVDQQLLGENVELSLEVAVAKMYGISVDAYKFVVDSFNLPEETKKTLNSMYKEKLEEGRDNKNMIYNHYASTLSELDMQIVHCVPPGGNWKDIPESIPSQRLSQIRDSYKAGKGSRSTYYGRLKSDMPAYTINTYFNRPGNGCHMHYDQDRTISQREAARFQSFPDSFEFIGSLGAVNKQIGNAVPPLLAYQIAKNIPFKGQFVDLFCGAGGLALGFTWAGWEPIIGNDIDEYAAKTHKKNLSGDVIVGDINNQEIHNKIISKAVLARAEHPELPLFVLGGPPCQGFSTANTRRGAEDTRNWLFKSYVNIVKEIQPEGFIFENVRGILNLDKGKFFEMIKQELKGCVEEINVIQVSAANYGIPQRRDRVIILGGNKNLVSSFYIEKISSIPTGKETSGLPPVVGVEEAIGDLPALQPGEDGSQYNYRFPASNPYQRFMRGELTPEEYLESYKE